jgi:hypothetical protein
MRVSQYFKLGLTQATLDFVDVDVKKDTPLFISPRALTMLPSEFGDECVHLIQSYLHKVIALIRAHQDSEAESLLAVLREPNETHLGLSKGAKSQGRALGDGSAHEVWSALSESEAARSGLLEDLEDTVLMIDGISIDIISDITTNIIREPLIRYTQQMSEYYGIPLQEGVDSGPLWSSKDDRWYAKFVSLPIASGEKLLLVPKAIVRNHLIYNSGEYFRHFVITHLQKVEMDANSALVEIIKKGTKAERKRVTKKSIIGKYGKGKATVARVTKKYPEILHRYKETKKDEKHLPLTLDDIAIIEGTASPDWDKLLSNILDCKPGTDHAGKYEKATEGLLTALMYPNLTNPIVQHEIHDGRKRIDITYTNMAVNGFFSWAAAHYPAAHVFVECKNYTRDLGNPELDQIAGRFSPSRGRIGLIVCRGFDDKDLFIERSRDTAKDDRGFIIPLDDGDLSSLVTDRKENALYSDFPILRDRFRKLLD